MPQHSYASLVFNHSLGGYACIGFSTCIDIDLIKLNQPSVHIHGYGPRSCEYSSLDLCWNGVGGMADSPIDPVCKASL